MQKGKENKEYHRLGTITLMQHEILKTESKRTV